jgi:hypothetical protein
MNSVFGNLPNVFVIGAAKSGTSSLAYMLNQHPQVFLSHAKEPHFFNDDERYSKGLQWYSDTFFSRSENFDIRLDASNAYLFWSEKVVERLLQTYEQPSKLKFIALFRDPVERAYSNYWMAKRINKEPLDFQEALHQEEERLERNHKEFYRLGAQTFGYFRGGSYASNLKPFLKTFSRDQFHFLIFDDFKKDAARSVQNVFRFLKVSDFQVHPLHKNPAALPRSRKFYDFLIQKDGTAKDFFRRLIPQNNLRKKFRMFLMNLVLKPIDIPPIPQEVERELRKRFAPEIKDLEKILERDLSDWL